MFAKVRFKGRAGETAGLIFDTDKLDAMTVQEISRRWPYSEALKMEVFQRSPDYATFEEALLHQFDNETRRI